MDRSYQDKLQCLEEDMNARLEARARANEDLRTQMEDKEYENEERLAEAAQAGKEATQKLRYETTS